MCERDFYRNRFLVGWTTGSNHSFDPKSRRGLGVAGHTHLIQCSSSALEKREGTRFLLGTGGVCAPTTINNLPMRNKSTLGWLMNHQVEPMENFPPQNFCRNFFKMSQGHQCLWEVQAASSCLRTSQRIGGAGQQPSLGHTFCWGW